MEGKGKEGMGGRGREGDGCIPLASASRWHSAEEHGKIGA